MMGGITQGYCNDGGGGGYNTGVCNDGGGGYNTGVCNDGGL